MTDIEKRQLIADWIEQNPKFILWLGHKIGWRLKRRTPTKDELDDFCQDIVASMLEYSHQYDPARGAITTWAEWRMRALISKAGLKKNQEILFQVTADFSDEAGTSWDETIPGREPDPLDVASHQELQAVACELIHQKIGELRPPQAWAVHGYLIEGQTKQQLAQRRGISDQSIRESVRYGKRNLRRSKDLKRLAQLMGVVG